MTNAHVAIVTGAAGGIGQAITYHLAQAGTNVVATDLDTQRLDDMIRAAPTSGGKIIGLAGNMLDNQLAPSLVEAATERFGSLHILVNCSGFLQDNRIEKMPVSQFRKLVDINLAGPLRLIDAVVPTMQKTGYGRIVSIASRAWLGNFGSSGYSCAKGGIVGATRALALALARDGITVNCIAPGFIDTPMARSLPPHILERVVDAIPVGRTGTVDDVSALVNYFVQPENGYVTGQTIVACGGRSISNPIVNSTKEKQS